MQFIQLLVEKESVRGELKAAGNPLVQIFKNALNLMIC